MISKDFTQLAFNSQRVFVGIERILLRHLTKELKITKEDIAWECEMSITGVKVALRELKETGYVIAKNPNSPVLRIGEEYEYKSDKQI